MKQLLLSTALIVGAGTMASAATISFTSDLADQRTNFSGAAIGVQQFDASLGTLESVEISLEGRVSGGARYESEDAAPGSIDLNLAAMVSLSTNALGQIIVTLPTITEIVNVTAFDGLFDFAGTSGGSVAGLTSSDTKSTTLLSGFAEFIGSGLVDLQLGGLGVSTATGPGNLTTGFQTYAGGEVTVTYTYTDAPAPVPLPAGMPLMLLGMGALGLAAKRRKA